MLLAYIRAMKSANIADIKNNFSKFISLVENGEAVVICKRNVPIARIVPIGDEPRTNQTRLGLGAGTVDILDDLTDPMMPEKSWQMLTDEDSP